MGPGERQTLQSSIKFTNFVDYVSVSFSHSQTATIAENDKVCIRPLEELRDYNLWHTRVTTAIDPNELDTAVSESFRNETMTEFKDQQRQTSNMLVNSLSDQDVRVFGAVMGKT